MTDTSAKNKRIAKNTLMLYFRTFLIMAISLYTSRVVINTLGVEDYGIYNVVGGVIMMFSAISGSLSSSISRFITYELGHGNLKRLEAIFSTSINIQLCISVLVLLLGELVGVWFLNYKLNIPADRLIAANWVLQCSLLTFVINLISVPYNATIIAHEQMKAFAYISILEASLKLAIVYMLLISPFDKLSTYAVLMVLVAFIIQLIYGMYCRYHFTECRYRFTHNKTLVKEMAAFAGWSFCGNSAYIFNTQGVSILMNLFFGVAINAARGIAAQAESAVIQFVNNFTMAINPQITKSYAARDFDYMFKLVFRGSKYAFFLMLAFVVPFISEAEYILTLWLKTVPENAPQFLQLTLFGALINSLGNSMLTAVSATGQIRKYQLYVTVVGCLVFPITWMAYKLGCPAFTAYIVYIVIYLLLIFIRLYIMKGLLQFPVVLYTRQVILRILVVLPPSFILPMIIVNTMNSSFLRLFIVGITSTLFIVSIIYLIGFEKDERIFFTNKICGLVQTKRTNQK